MLKREQKRGRPGQTVEVVRNVEDKKLWGIVTMKSLKIPKGQS